MANGYMPRKDSDALAWMETFAQGLADRPGEYPVTPEEIAAVAAAVERFAAALGVAREPGTRTSVAVSLKDAARLAAEDACRPIYARIRADKAIDDADKMVIGIRPMKATYGRVGVPATAPVLMEGELTWSRYAIGYRTAVGATGRAKPDGAAQLQVFRALGDGPTKSVEEATYFRAVSRSPMWVGYTSADDGKVATYFARWVTRRGEVGPWSAPLSVRVASMSLKIGSRLAA